VRKRDHRIDFLNSNIKFGFNFEKHLEVTKLTRKEMRITYEKKYFLSKETVVIIETELKEFRILNQDFHQESLFSRKEGYLSK
jgi:hypothetical protein